jgi:ATP-dependent DNA helicase RecG
MRINALESKLLRLEQLIRLGRFEEQETDTLEIKPVPPTGKDWIKLKESVCSFLNTRGGFLILGIKEVGQGNQRRYEHSGWRADAENELRALPSQFTDRKRRPVDLREFFPPPHVRPFLDGEIAVQLVDELPADRRYVFLDGKAYQRHLTGDRKLSREEVDAQEEFKQESQLAQELQIVPNTSLKNIDLEKVNEYISLLNRPTRIETPKRDLKQARPFLERKAFLHDSKATILGMLASGKHPADHLGFRAHLHGYVDAAHEVVRDKQDMIDNVLQLMERGYSYLLRNIQVGVSISQSGSPLPQYPEQLLRETVNNALAHRDYSMDRQVILSIKPGHHISISNPGSFRDHLLIRDDRGNRHIARIIPEAKPRNPKLADVLRVYRKWEGRGIGMATMVNFCLQNQIDLPYYHFHSNEVTLYLCSGQLLDDRMERLFESYEGYIQEKLSGGKLSATQKLVLSYLIKSEWANQKARYTILLTPDNNHFTELHTLEQSGLIEKHSSSLAHYPVYVVTPLLLRRDYLREVRKLIGPPYEELNSLEQQSLSMVFRFERFSTRHLATAKSVAYALWYDLHPGENDIVAFDRFYRSVRLVFNKLTRMGYVNKLEKGAGYRLASRKQLSEMPLFPEKQVK